MNTIPLIFNERQINRTIIGGRVKQTEAVMDVSVILLNSNGSHFRLQTLETLSKCGFASVISIEPDSGNFNIEEISRRMPSVKFIIPLEKVTDGDMINIGMSEVDSSYVLVLRDSLYISAGVLQPRLADHLTAKGNYCIVPRLLDSAKNALPVQFSPSAQHGHLKIVQSSVVTDGMKTLYPFDYIGLYNRLKFIQLGGFDYTITSPYYQNLDLALRSWLWGEETTLSTRFLFSFIETVPIEDMTADLTYLHFYLKNLLPRVRFDHGMIPDASFLTFLVHSSCGFFESHRQFKDAQQWVDTNKFRFHTDIQHLIENWVIEK
ncbi:MAG: hypothetical protein M0P01_00680 [Treponema sp.]|nr:hypothetical protein [Treponema sp.]